MKQRLETWAADYRALYSAGLTALAVVVLAVTGAGLLGLVPYLLLTPVVGQWTALALVAAVILPPLLGSFLHTARVGRRDKR